MQRVEGCPRRFQLGPGAIQIIQRRMVLGARGIEFKAHGVKLRPQGIQLARGRVPGRFAGQARLPRRLQRVSGVRKLASR